MKLVAPLFALIVGSVAPAAADETSNRGEVAVSLPGPSAPSDPCAHRALCGKISIIPKDRDERRAWFTLVVAMAADDIVTTRGLALNGRRFPDPLNRTAFSTWRGEYEGDPLARPFVRSASSPLFFWSAALLTIRPLTLRHLDVRARSLETYGEAASHIYGFLSWLPALHRETAFAQHHDACATQLVGTPTVGIGPATTAYVPAPLAAACQQFTGVKLVPNGK